LYYGWHVTFNPNLGTPTITQKITSSGNGQNLIVAAQSTQAVSSTGGNLYLNAGAGEAGSSIGGNAYVQAGSGTLSDGIVIIKSQESSNPWVAFSSTQATFYVPVIQFASSTTPTITQPAAASGNGAALTLQAQQGAAGANGGDLLLEGGLAGAGGTAGTIRLGVGGYTGITINPGGGTFGQVNFSNGFTVTINDTTDTTAFTCNGHAFINNTMEVAGTLKCDNILDVYAGGVVPALEVNSTTLSQYATGESHTISRTAGFAVSEDIQWHRATSSSTSPLNFDITISTDGYYSVDYDVTAADTDMFGSVTLSTGIVRCLFYRSGGTLFTAGLSTAWGVCGSFSTPPWTTGAPNNNTLRFTVTPPNTDVTIWIIKANVKRMN